MTERERSQKIALFYVLILLDEKVALQAATKAVALLKSRELWAVNTELPEYRHVLAMTCVDVLASYKIPKLTTVQIGTKFVLPKNLRLDAWVKFHHKTKKEELLTTVLAKIWDYSDEEVAECFDVSAGTIRYRLARSLREIGEHAHE